MLRHQLINGCGNIKQYNRMFELALANPLALDGLEIVNTLGVSDFGVPVVDCESNRGYDDFGFPAFNVPSSP